MAAATASSSTSSSESILTQICAPYLPFDAASSVWDDITPVYQSETASPMCPIMYAPAYSSAMDLYRALVAADSPTCPTGNATPEYSARALALTQHLIQLNPSHYSIWHFRAQILLNSASFENNRDQILAAELEFLDNLAHQNMKSYQVWQHRRIVVAALGDPSRELGFVTENLDKDAKNYHTWAYRQWVLAHFGGLPIQDPTCSKARIQAGRGAAAFPHLWDGELAYVDQLLDQDIRNNSAWNHRWFCVFGRYGHTGAPVQARNAASSSTAVQDDDEEAQQALGQTIDFEIAYTKARIATAPNNPSAWNYFRALHTGIPSCRRGLSASLPFAKNLVSTPLEAERDPRVDQQGRSPPQALEWWLDSIAEPSQLQPQPQSQLQSQQPADTQSKTETLRLAESLVKRLLVADPVRKRFWAYRFKQITAAVRAVPSTA
ncbi:protein prenylyltransferase [Testicularia cyperi]|uniref:Protein farnesyltransferase/geranylgeranyltransferase type-1 subunit alpha n=1 Tax=Testicularia cyperi TaxID=1882483 RepID=A0A317XRB0_9BASI|nr:protein prenylyltransferase [Testicularia cyperi]